MTGGDAGAAIDRFIDSVNVRLQQPNPADPTEVK
jgi:hypothetical protein